MKETVQETEQQFISKATSLVRIFYGVCVVVVIITAYIIFMRADVNANTTLVRENKAEIKEVRQRVDDKFDLIIDKLNKIEIKIEADKNLKHGTNKSN